MERLTVCLAGRVQMVGFRAFTYRLAVSLGLTGFVRNTADGRVEVAAEGPRPMLERLLAALHDGPSGAIVEEVASRWGVATGEWPDFRIRR